MVTNFSVRYGRKEAAALILTLMDQGHEHFPTP
jgi:hypothetical protein